MKIEDLSTDPQYSVCKGVVGGFRTIDAKLFRIDGIIFEIGEQGGGGYVLCSHKDIHSDMGPAMVAAAEIAIVAESIADLDETVVFLNVYEGVSYDEYVTAIRKDAGADYLGVWDAYHRVNGQNYFPLPPNTQRLIYDLEAPMREDIPDPGYVYILKSETGHWKIGRTVSPANRQKTFSVKLPFRVNYEMVIPSDDHKALEASLHERFAYCRLDGEWFELTDGDIADLKREFENVAEQFNE